VTLVRNGLNIQGLSPSISSIAADDAFYVQSGYENSGGGFHYAPVSASGGALTVTLASDNTAAGQLKTQSDSSSPVDVNIGVNAYNSPSSFATGGPVLDPIAAGPLTVTATATGFDNTWANAAQLVSVTQPEIGLSDIYWGDYRIGGGLQVPYRVSLSGSEHGGLTVRIASSNTARLLVSPAATTAGTAFIDLVFANGETYKDFYVQGVKGGTGVATLTATSTGFTSATRDVTVVQAVIAVHSLSSSIGSGAANDPFQVRTGYTSSGGGFLYAPVNPNGAIPVIVRSSNVAAAQLVSGTGSGNQITVEVPINAFDSPATLATGGMELDPLTAGTTTISTEANSFDNSYSTSYQSVTVTP
jgi:hypothetical protein